MASRENHEQGGGGRKSDFADSTITSNYTLYVDLLLAKNPIKSPTIGRRHIKTDLQGLSRWA